MTSLLSEGLCPKQWRGKMVDPRPMGCLANSSLVSLKLSEASKASKASCPECEVWCRVTMTALKVVK